MLFGVFSVWVFFRCKVNTDSYLHPHGESEGGDEMTGIHPKHIFMFYLKWKLYVMEGVQRKWQAHGRDSEWHKRTNKPNLCCEDKWTDDRKRPRRWSEVRAARNTETGWRNVTHAVNELPACLPEWRPGRKKKPTLVGCHLVGTTDALCCRLQNGLWVRSGLWLSDADHLLVPKGDSLFSQSCP